MKLISQYLHIAMRISVLISAIIFPLSSMLIAGTSNGQVFEKKLDIHVENKSLFEAVRYIEKQSNVEFAFDAASLRLKEHNVKKLKFSNTPLREILDALFSGTSVAYREEVSGVVSLYKRQEQGTLSGKITDEKGEPLPGASVRIASLNRATTTGSDGRYAIRVAPGIYTVDFRFISYQVQTRNGVVIQPGKTTSLDIRMSQDVSKLNEVVVTALGISREAKSIGFSVQKVSGEEVQEAHETNLLNTLSGKVAGVQITSASGGIGASSNIQIRGQNFVSGYNYNNSPLFVVDGVPVSNNNEQSTRAFTGRQDFNNPNFTSGEGEVDYGNAAAEIDPNDIEEMTVLKGPNAAALYGSRASNGVALITTKSGRGTKGIGVSFNSQTSFESPLKLPDYQYVYGQGREGQYAYVNGAGAGTNDNLMENWGPRMDGRLIAQYDSPVDPATGQRTPTPFVAQPNQLKDFFETGKTYTNNLSIQGSNDKLNFRFSYTNTSQTGIVPNTDMHRNAVTLNAGYAMTPKLKLDASINYVNSGSDNRTSYGAKNDDAIMKIFLFMPRNVSVASLRNYWREGSGNQVQNSPIFSENGTILNNPYFVANENLNGNDRDRVFGNIRFTYNFLPNFKVMLRTGRDYYNDKRTMRHANSSAQYVNGFYQEDDVYFLETNHDVLFSYDKEFGSDFSFSASAGGNLMMQKSKRLGAIAPRLAIPGLYTLTNNASPIIAGNTYQEKKINSVYGTSQIGFKKAVFLDLTARNDWSSALPEQNNSYFYPSASLSVVMTDLLGLNSRYLSFLKLRSSASSVRRDLEPYQTAYTYKIAQGWGGETVASHNNNLPNADIRPEKVASYEFGFDSRFMRNRIGIDFTWYKSTTTDLIIPVTLNPSAGYDTKLMNVGKMTNTGIELMLNLKPIQSKNFNWTSYVNFAKNDNKVLELAEDLGISRIRQLERWASLELRTVNTKGDGSSGSLYGDYLIYQNGSLTLKNGLPQEENGDWAYLGNANPDWTAGIGNEFSYKRFSLSGLFSIQKGGAVYSRTYIEGIRAGSLKESLVNRDENGGGTMVAEGIDVNTGQPNTVPVTVRNYWRSYYDNDDIGTFDASYVKLREVKLSYRLPERFLGKAKIKSAAVSFVGRNLILWSDVPNIDPEVSSYDGKFQGVETMSLPSLRSYGFALNLSF